MRDSTQATPFKNKVCAWTLAGALQLVIHSSLFAESFVESRYQYYQEDHHRIRVDSNYWLFNVDLKETLSLDGSFLYSAISGASPSGLPQNLPDWTKSVSAFQPIKSMQDERSAVSLGLNKQFENHALKVGYAHSSESDYLSQTYSIQDTISFNQKNTELVLGYSYAGDRVDDDHKLRKSKCSQDAILGINQVLTPGDLLSVNVTVGIRHGFLNDPYKQVLKENETLFGTFYNALPERRPSQKREELLFVQWTHYIKPLAASLETAYRFGHNDWGSLSNTARFALYKKFQNNRLIVGPSFRYYRQTAARFYKTSFAGNPEYYSSDYRLSAEETFSSGLQVRWFAVKDKLAFDAGYERYVSRGLDHQTPQMAYPSANSVTIGLHYQF